MYARIVALAEMFAPLRLFTPHNSFSCNTTRMGVGRQHVIIKKDFLWQEIPFFLQKKQDNLHCPAFFISQNDF